MLNVFMWIKAAGMIIAMIVLIALLMILKTAGFVLAIPARIIEALRSVVCDALDGIKKGADSSIEFLDELNY